MPDLTFKILRDSQVSALAVSDLIVLQAMRIAFQEFKIVLEPSAAIALAAVLDGKINTSGKTIVVICTGGNVDPAQYRKALE